MRWTKARKNPDHRAKSVDIESDEMKNNGKVVLTGTHHGFSYTARGNAKVKIKDQYSVTAVSKIRPKKGTIIKGESIVVEGRHIKPPKGPIAKGRRMHLSMDDDVRISVDKKKGGN